MPGHAMETPEAKEQSPSMCLRPRCGCERGRESACRCEHHDGGKKFLRTIGLALGGFNRMINHYDNVCFSRGRPEASFFQTVFFFFFFQQREPLDEDA